MGKTGKRIEANSENEQLIDLALLSGLTIMICGVRLLIAEDGFWAIFFTVAGVTCLFDWWESPQKCTANICKSGWCHIPFRELPPGVEESLPVTVWVGPGL